MSADFVAHMEEVLDLYEEPYDPRRPVVCFADLHPGPRITLKCVCTAEPSDSISNHNGGQDESRSNHIRQRIKEHIRALENNGIRYNRVLPYPPMALQLTRFSGEEAAWPPTLPPGVVRGVRRHVRGKVVAIKLPNVWLQLPGGFPAVDFGSAERAVQGLSQVPE